MSERAGRTADLVLRNGTIHATVRPRPDASAVAIADGAVLAVGDDASLAALIGPETAVHDLDGATVLPAFIDSHTHFHRAAMVRRLSLDFEQLRPGALSDVAAAVRERAATLPPNAWIQGDSLAAARLAEGRWPDRRLLDEAGGGRPVVLRGIGKHVVAASSAALAAAAIDRTTLDPPGGRIERDADGTPTGVLHERAKLRLDSSDPETVVPQASRAERLEALRAAFGDLHRLGITTIHEMIRLPVEADDLAALHAAGELPIRVRLYYRIHETPIRLEHLEALGIRSGLGDDRFRVAGVKISVDGWCIFRNAAVERPYLGEPDNRGLLRIEPAELIELTSRANARGLAIALHAVGPRAVDAALDAFEAAGPAMAPPFRLEHAHLDLDLPRLERMRRLGVAWSVQPALLSAYREDWAAVLEPDRVDAILRLATADRLGIPILQNSDVPSGPEAPLLAIRNAVTRDAVDGRPPLGADESISLERAWQGWTTVAAWAARDHRLGHLRPGALADVVVLDGDPFADADAMRSSTPRVVATIAAGHVVHVADAGWFGAPKAIATAGAFVPGDAVAAPGPDLEGTAERAILSGTDGAGAPTP